MDPGKDRNAPSVAALQIENIRWGPINSRPFHALSDRGILATSFSDALEDARVKKTTTTEKTLRFLLSEQFTLSSDRTLYFNIRGRPTMSIEVDAYAPPNERAGHASIVFEFKAFSGEDLSSVLNRARKQQANVIEKLLKIEPKAKRVLVIALNEAKFEIAKANALKNANSRYPSATPLESLDELNKDIILSCFRSKSSAEFLVRESQLLEYYSRNRRLVDLQQGK